jgi:hypothetical protein
MKEAVYGAALPVVIAFVSCQNTIKLIVTEFIYHYFLRSAVGKYRRSTSRSARFVSFLLLEIRGFRSAEQRWRSHLARAS